MNTETKITAEEAERALYAEYYSEVRSVAAEVIKEAKARGEEESDIAHEMIEGHEFVIYTHKAQMVLFVSESSDAAWDEGCAPDMNSAPEWSALAYWAMRADVERLLSNSYFRADYEKEDSSEE